jgi:hypothetical protein
VPAELAFGPGQPRWGLEEAVEAYLLEIAEGLIPADPGREDLKVARDYLPQWYGGLFPNLGLQVTRSRGESPLRDKPHLPGRLDVVVMIYEPSLPAVSSQSVTRGSGAGSRAFEKEDRTGPAKFLTRRIRNEFIDALFASDLASFVRDLDSQGGNQDAIGMPLMDDQERNVLWFDQTTFWLEMALTRAEGG